MPRKVKLMTPRVLGNGQTQDFGDVIEVDPREAERLIKAGQALPVSEPTQPQAGGSRSRR
jgi:hypothetical protein